MYEEHEGRDKASVQATQNSIAAGRDINNQRSFFAQFFLGADQPPPPRPDSPHLQDCPHCGRPWLSKFALFCPTCGYSVQMARQIRKQRENVNFICAVFAAMFGLLVMAVGLAVYMGHELTTKQLINTLFLAGLALLSAGLAYASYWGRRFDP